VTGSFQDNFSRARCDDFFCIFHDDFEGVIMYVDVFRGIYIDEEYMVVSRGFVDSPQHRIYIARLDARRDV
jgi:hypothetical protein